MDANLQDGTVRSQGHAATLVSGTISGFIVMLMKHPTPHQPIVSCPWTHEVASRSDCF